MARRLRSCLLALTVLGLLLPGLGDVAFFHADSRKVLAAGHAGKARRRAAAAPSQPRAERRAQVFLWDTRTGHRPRASLTAPRSSGQLLSLQLAADDQARSAAERRSCAGDS
jgi:hypothetical protein